MPDVGNNVIDQMREWMLDADLHAPFFSPKRRQRLERNIPSEKTGSKLRCKTKLSSMSGDEGQK